MKCYVNVVNRSVATINAKLKLLDIIIQKCLVVKLE